MVTLHDQAGTLTHNPKNTKKGDIVSVQVAEIEPSRVLVHFEDGREGFIRNRELSWKRSRGDPDFLLNVGDIIDVAVLSTDYDTNTFELSLRQVQGNPWDKLAQQGYYEPGVVVTGEVVNIEYFGAFIELEPGIDALLHISQIPGSHDDEIQKLLWVGDQVEVVIQSVNYEDRRIEVSINTRPSDDQNRPDSQAVSRPPAQAAVEPAPSPHDAAALPCRVLVIDNDCEWAEAFATILDDTGCKVGFICDDDEINALFQPTPLDYQIAFIDIELTSASGIELASRIHGYNPDIEIFLITGLSKDEAEVPPDLKVSILFKPITPATVSEHLARLSARFPFDAQHTGDSDHNSRSNMPFRLRASGETIGAVMRDVKRETEAEMVFVFSVDAFTEEVKIVNALADDLDIIEQLQERRDLLRFSSVKDVAFENEPIWEHHALNSRRLGKLINALYFESCIGVPVPFSEPDARYVLFLFHSDSNHFQEVDVKLTSASAYRIAAQFQQNRVYTMLVDAQQQALNGQLASRLAHEIRNQLNGITIWSEHLVKNLQAVTKDPFIATNQEWQNKQANAITKIKNRSDECSLMVNNYLGLVQDKVQETDVNELLESVMHQIEPLTKSKNFRAKLVPDLQPELPVTWVPSLRLKQVFLNVALNAIQQMSIQGSHGTLWITTRYIPDAPLEVRFTDSGPGIHRKHWERVFEPGFTTRTDGTGLGLFVSRSMMESMGGQISVESSYMFARTTFLIRLPVVGRE